MQSPIDKEEARVILQLMDRVPVPGSQQRRVVTMIENKLAAFVNTYDAMKAAEEEKDDDGEEVQRSSEPSSDRAE